MNYQKIYDQLIQKRRVQVINKDKKYPGAVEYHHIVPIACKGEPTVRRAANNHEGTNLVGLTPKEHFTAHHLLAKIFVGTVHEEQMIRAFQLMCNMNLDVRTGKDRGIKVTGIVYEKVRKQVAQFDSMRKRGTRFIHDPVTLINKLIPRDQPLPQGFVEGRYLSPEALKKIGDTARKCSTGRKLSPEHKAKIIAGLTGRKLSEENKEKIRTSLKGHKLSKETRDKIAKKCSELSKGRTFFTNGIKNVFVHPGEEPEGYWPGCTRNSKKKKAKQT